MKKERIRARASRSSIRRDWHGARLPRRGPSGSRPFPALRCSSLSEVSPKNGYTFGISMEFADRAAYVRYNEHPDHIRFVQERSAVRGERVPRILRCSVGAGLAPGTLTAAGAASCCRHPSWRRSPSWERERTARVTCRSEWATGGIPWSRSSKARWPLMRPEPPRSFVLPRGDEPPAGTDRLPAGGRHAGVALSRLTVTRFGRCSSTTYPERRPPSNLIAPDAQALQRWEGIGLEIPGARPRPATANRRVRPQPHSVHLA